MKRVEAIIVRPAMVVDTSDLDCYGSPYMTGFYYEQCHRACGPAPQVARTPLLANKSKTKKNNGTDKQTSRPGTANHSTTTLPLDQNLTVGANLTANLLDSLMIPTDAGPKTSTPVRGQLPPKPSKKQKISPNKPLPDIIGNVEAGPPPTPAGCSNATPPMPRTPKLARVGPPRLTSTPVLCLPPETAPRPTRNSLTKASIPDDIASPPIGDFNVPPPTSTGITSVNDFSCPECGQRYKTLIGLQVHRQKKHPEEYNAGLKNDKIKLRWEAQDRDLMARLEADCLYSVKSGSKKPNINQYLHSKFPERTLESIKSQRKSQLYKDMVQNHMASNTSPGVELPLKVIDEPASHPGSTSTDSSTDPNRVAILNFLSEKILERPKNKQQELMWECASNFIQNRPYEGMLQSYITNYLITKASPPYVKKPCKMKYGPLTRSETKRQAYAKTQKTFRKNRAHCARMILDGETSHKITDCEGFTKFWSEMMTADPPPPPSSMGAPKASQDSDYLVLVQPISIEDTEWALKGAKKAIGPDGVTLAKLRKADRVSLCCLLNIVFASLQVPIPLRAAKLTFIPKEDAASSPDKFRPIAVGSYVQRTLNKILAFRLRQSLRLSKVQRAFLPCDGLMENLTILDSVINDARLRLRELRLASIDLKKAFDMVTHDSILTSLKNRGMPTLFTNYIKSLYEDSETIIRFGDSERTITPTRGVRQGDPLSPLIFNAIIDDLIVKLEVEGFGYPIKSENQTTNLLGIAFADDLILLAPSKATLQRILDQTAPFLLERGLEINTKKSFTMSLVPLGKEKKVKTITEDEFRIGGDQLPASSPTAIWKYLGVQFNSKGRTTCPSKSIDDYLLKIDKAPLKPHQRLAILKEFLIPRFLHPLTCGPIPSAKRLNDIDLSIRRHVKHRWLKWPPGVPNAFLYTTINEGGLGIPSMRTFIPRLRQSRLCNLEKSDHPAISWSLTSNHGKTQTSRVTRLCNIQGFKILHKANEDSFWHTKLSRSIDGGHLSNAKDVPFVHQWVKGMPYLSGKEYIMLLKVRTNSLPCRSRMARGQININRRCRMGCPYAESLNHLLQCCPLNRSSITKRHDDVLLRITKSLTKVGHNVTIEPIFTIPGLDKNGRPRVLKPDILVTTQTDTWLLDLEIVGSTRNLAAARQAKIKKYNIDTIKSQLPRMNDLPIHIGSIHMTYSGIWEKDSAKDLQSLGLSKKTMIDITVNAIQGSLRIFRQFMKSTKD